MSRVLLINSNRRNDLFAAPPIGLCYVASAAEAAGHQVNVLDLCFEPCAFRALEDAVKRFSPEVVGVSIRNIDNANMLHPISYLPEIKEIVAYVRRICTAPVVLGGTGASLAPENILELLEADYVVEADGERVFVELLNSLGKGGPIEGIAGVGANREGHFRMEQRAFQDFPSLRPHVGRWIDLKPYAEVGGRYNIQTKRGCPHRCIYCTYSLLEGNCLRLRSPIDVVDEIEEAFFKFKSTQFEFVDSVFNDPPDHCSEILEEIVRRPWKACFSAMGVSPRYVDFRFLKLMRRAGFDFFWITPESASQKMIGNYRKGFNLDHVERAAEAIEKARFRVMWEFLIGGPGETNDTLQESLDFTIRRLNADNAIAARSMANYFLGVRVYPGTALWSVAHEEGFIHNGSNPLDQLWYISEELDLDPALHQMVEAAKICPGIISGLDEERLNWTPVLAFLGKFLGMSGLHWKILHSANRYFRKAALRFTFEPHLVVSAIRHRLAAQGYKGVHLGAGRATGS